MCLYYSSSIISLISPSVIFCLYISKECHILEKKHFSVTVQGAWSILLFDKYNFALNFYLFLLSRYIHTSLNIIWKKDTKWPEKPKICAHFRGSIDFSLNIVSFPQYVGSPTHNFDLLWSFRNVEKVFGWIFHTYEPKFISNIVSDLFWTQYLLLHSNKLKNLKIMKWRMKEVEWLILSCLGVLVTDGQKQRDINHNFLF